MAINPLALITMAINQPALMAIIRPARQQLTHPVLVVDAKCPRWEPVAGAGFVLVDRWRIVAQGASQFTCRLANTGPAMAREFAARWAPGVAIANSYEQFLAAMDTDSHWSIGDLYRRARDEANMNAVFTYQRSPSPLRPPIDRAVDEVPPPGLLERVLRRLW